MIDLNSINYNSGVNVISKLQQATSVNTDFSSLMSTETTSMDDIFEEASETYNVPISLVKAVAKAESNFNADAVSSAGAQGVMQLMPATAKSLGVNDSFDAYENIMGGTKYLGQLLDKYDGDVSLALAGYNAGMGNVAKYGGVPPFTETKNYIEKVMDYAKMDLDSNATYTPSSNNPTNFVNTFTNSFNSNLNGITNSSTLNSSSFLNYNDEYTDLTSFITNFTEFTNEQFLYFLELMTEEMSASAVTNNLVDQMLHSSLQKIY